MAKITIVKGDMFESAANIFCDAVNCIGPHGAGVAAVFERRAPAYSAHYRHMARSYLVHPRLPTVQLFDPTLQKTCFAVPTMFYPGERAEKRFIELSLWKMRDAIRPGDHIAMPALGCGIGSLPFTTLIELVYQTFALHDADCPLITIDLYEPL